MIDQWWILKKRNSPSHKKTKSTTQISLLPSRMLSSHTINMSSRRESNWINQRVSISSKNPWTSKTNIRSKTTMNSILIFSNNTLKRYWRKRKWSKNLKIIQTLPVLYPWDGSLSTLLPHSNWKRWIRSSRAKPSNKMWSKLTKSKLVKDLLLLECLDDIKNEEKITANG